MSHQSTMLSYVCSHFDIAFSGSHFLLIKDFKSTWLCCAEPVGHETQKLRGHRQYFSDRPFQSQILRGNNEYWCALKFNCGTRYAWILQCLVGRLIGVMYSSASIATRPFVILNSIVRRWYLYCSSSKGFNKCIISYCLEIMGVYLEIFSKESK